MRYSALSFRVDSIYQYKISRALPAVSLESDVNWCLGGILQWLAICEDVQNCDRALCQEDQGGGSRFTEKLSDSGVGFACHWSVLERRGESAFSSAFFQAENKRGFFPDFAAEIFKRSRWADIQAEPVQKHTCSQKRHIFIIRPLHKKTGGADRLILHSQHDWMIFLHLG